MALAGELCKLEQPDLHIPSLVGCRRRRVTEVQQQQQPELARGGSPLLMTVDAGETDLLYYSKNRL